MQKSIQVLKYQCFVWLIFYVLLQFYCSRSFYNPCTSKYLVTFSNSFEARKKANMTQQELSEKSGIIQPSIAKIENFVRTPQYTTLMKMLYAMGYTLSVVPLEEKIKKGNKEAEVRQ